MCIRDSQEGLAAVGRGGQAAEGHHLPRLPGQHRPAGRAARLLGFGGIHRGLPGDGRPGQDARLLAAGLDAQPPHHQLRQMGRHISEAVSYTHLTQLQQELLNTWEKEQKTCFFITHDVEEAIILAQRVVIMCARPGRVKEIVDIDIPYPCLLYTSRCV